MFVCLSFCLSLSLALFVYLSVSFFLGLFLSFVNELNRRHQKITGPNMGGKSTYIRGVALIAILAQIGSFVPADECSLSPFDAVFVRMGAEDCLHEGRSTFFSELLSTSSILEVGKSKKNEEKKKRKGSPKGSLKENRPLQSAVW